MPEMKKCGWCGQFKEVYAYQEVDYEEVEGTPKSELLVENPKKTLKDNDVVGLPQCRECYNEERGK